MLLNYVTRIYYYIMLGEPSKLKMSQIVEKVQKGEGGQRQNQNTHFFFIRTSKIQLRL